MSKFVGTELPAEYTDLLLLLSRLPFKLLDSKVYIRTYSEKDIRLLRASKGESFTFCDGSPLKLYGMRLCIENVNISDDNLWDVYVESSNPVSNRLKNSSYLNNIESICETYGYTFLRATDTGFYLERMDRVIFNGYSIDGSQELCNDFDLDYNDICTQALAKRRSTYQILKDRILESDMDRMYNATSGAVDKVGNEVADAENKISSKSNVERTRVFNDNKESESS